MRLILLISLLLNIILTISLILCTSKREEISIVDLEKRRKCIDELEQEYEAFQVKIEALRLEYEDNLINILKDLEYYYDKRNELLEELKDFQEKSS